MCSKFWLLCLLGLAMQLISCSDDTSGSQHPYVRYFYPILDEPKIYVYRDVIGGLDEQFHRVYCVNDH